MVIPVRNEEDSISVLLECLCRQTRTPDEIVITDGGSIDRTVEIIESYDSGSIPIIVCRESDALPGRGRNVAAKHASSEWLAFVDAGIQPEATWLEHLEKKVLDNPEVDVVYGSWEPIINNFIQECASIAYLPPRVEIDGVSIRPRFIASCLMKREVWRSVGGFPENLRSAEDLLFMNKVAEAGFRTVYVPDALVRWNIQPTLWKTFRRFKLYSRHNMRAGLWKTWQRTIITRYSLLLVLAVVCFGFEKLWPLLPLVLWLMMLGSRSVIALWRHRATSPASVSRNIFRNMALILIISVLDAATIAGVADWVLRDRFSITSYFSSVEGSS